MFIITYYCLVAVTGFPSGVALVREEFPDWFLVDGDPSNDDGWETPRLQMTEANVPVRERDRNRFVDSDRGGYESKPMNQPKVMR